MSARVLGVTPLTPGFKTMAIRPAICDLTSAKGKVPTPLGNVAVSWTLTAGRFALDVKVPGFDRPAALADGAAAKPAVRVTAGSHHFEVRGKFIPLAVEEEQSAEGLDKDLVKDDLLHRFLAKTEDHCSHTGGGRDASALTNGTTLNGCGGEATMDDGRTFRGYGDGDWLVFRLKKPCDLTEIRSFSNHIDSRASQSYAVLVAKASAPERFIELTDASKPANSRYVYLGVEMENEGGGLNDPDTWPPKGSQWFGVSRRMRADIAKGAPFAGGKGGKGDTLLTIGIGR